MTILASQSPRRKKLLEQINISFKVEPSSCEETFNANEQPSVIVQELAMRKAKDIAKGKKDALVIGADTIVVFKNEILGKPDSKTEAERMLSKLSGNLHSVYTGVALIKTDDQSNIFKEKTFSEETKVYFGKLTESEIKSYVASGSPMDKAGSYGIQDDWGALFVEKIEGDYNNVVGLPLPALYRCLKTFAPEVIPSFNENTDND